MMPKAKATLLTIAVNESTRVSGLLQRAPQARACLVLAHGAGAGMRHPFMADTAEDLADLGIATLRYQFPYMEQGGRRPDPPALCHATVRAAVAMAHELEPELALIAGGKSFGGRMTSQTQAANPLAGVRGLVFFGFPLHAPNQPSVERAQHLFEVQIPMLFLQGSRDTFARMDLLRPLIERLGKRASLKVFEHADHSFHVPARSGMTDAQVRAHMLQALVKTAWIAQLSEAD